MRRLVGISGNSGSGKDTLGAYFAMNCGFSLVHFADSLKRACSEKYGIPLRNFYDPALKEVPDKYWKISPRVIAQFEGTEGTREIIEKLVPGVGDNFWVWRLTKEVREWDKDVVVADVRFSNEARWVLDSGGLLIHLVRPGFTGNVGLRAHASEGGYSIAGSKHAEGAYHVISNDESIDLLCQRGQIILNNFFGIKS